MYGTCLCWYLHTESMNVVYFVYIRLFNLNIVIYVFMRLCVYVTLTASAV